MSIINEIDNMVIKVLSLTVAHYERERGYPAATVFCSFPASFYTLYYVYTAPRTPAADST